jgi:hypothetical protein
VRELRKHCSDELNRDGTGSLNAGIRSNEHITGNGDVWGVNVNGQIFQYNFITATWVQIPGTLKQITVGVNDVWGLDAAGNAYRYQGSAGFVQIVAARLIQLVAGGNGVWGMGNVALFTKDNSQGTGVVRDRAPLTELLVPHEYSDHQMLRAEQRASFSIWINKSASG